MRGLVAINLLTTPLSRRKSDSVILGSPSAARRFGGRKSLVEGDVGKEIAGRRVSVGREAWMGKEFGTGMEGRRAGGVRDMIALLTPKKVRGMSPLKMTPRKEEMKSEGAESVSGEAIPRDVQPESPVKIWRDEEDFEPITLGEFLSMTNISFLDGLGPSTARRRTVLPRPSILPRATLSDYAVAGAVTLPILSLYQFVPPPRS
jgi:Spc7 kinetochore protein